MKMLSIALLGAALSGCAADEADTPGATGEPQTFDAVGTVISIEGEHVLIDHDDIPGFMDAMTMSFPVSDAALLDGLDAGAKVTFRVVVDGASYEVDRIERRD